MAQVALLAAFEVGAEDLALVLAAATRELQAAPYPGSKFAPTK